MAEADGPSEDAFFGGRLVVSQPRRGHRSGTDAVLLAMSAPATAGEIVDIGAGVGVVGLGAALRSPGASVTLVETAPDLAALAEANRARAGRAGRVIVADILNARARRAAGLADGQAALALTNPPFHAAGRVRAPADAGRALAHVLPAEARRGAPLALWIRACLALLAPGGAFRMIHRADALGPTLEAIGGRIGALRILPVHPRADAPATRLLLAGVKGARAPLAILPGLVLHEAGGGFTACARAIAAGEAHLFENAP
ncbi:MAG: methyltransferase [Methylobacteriaceae bacterium]|nr:methyltransferase [Methylobacteriaceae bacterium]